MKQWIQSTYKTLTRKRQNANNEVHKKQSFKDSSWVGKTKKRVLLCVGVCCLTCRGYGHR